MNRRVLLIDNYDSFTFNLLQMLEESGICSVEVVKNDELDLSMPSRFDKILISPGPGVPSEAGLVLEVLKSIGSTKSVLGICLGHQAIAECYGGSLYRTTETAHGLTKEIMIEEKSEQLFGGIPRKFSAGLYHSWAVDPVSLPPCFSVTARSADGIIMALTHKEFDVRGIQFHPESIMTPFGFLILKNWLTI
jgi:anthranilate synthase component 2